MFSTASKDVKQGSKRLCNVEDVVFCETRVVHGTTKTCPYHNPLKYHGLQPRQVVPGTTSCRKPGRNNNSHSRNLAQRFSTACQSSQTVEESTERTLEAPYQTYAS